jgi:predicted phosphodiesterase
MRIVVVSDVHSNTEALSAVFRHAEAGGAVDAVWSLGDMVGYGPEPAQVLAMLRERSLTPVAGNHDLAAAAGIGIDEFNSFAAHAALWSGDQLSEAERQWLLELQQSLVTGGFTLVHGTLREPVWEYLLSPEQALVQFELQPTPYSLVGHSHLPLWFEEAPSAMPRLRIARDGQRVALGETRLILNPGSVGQPRDGDPRASYLLYDDGAATATWHRVEYDIAATQAKMRAARLPQWLSERLSMGK